LGDDSNGANISPKTIFAIVAATTSFVIITQLDVVLANKFFSPVMASQYAAAAILGKAILYIAGGLVFALFPMVVSNDVNRISSAHLMKQAILLTIVFCLPICIVYFFFGGHLITFFYGDKYPEAGNLLSYFGFAMLPMALILVMEHFLLAKSRILFTLIVMLLVPIQIFIIYRWHDSLFNLIGSVFFIGSLAFLVGVVILFREFKLSISNK
jgi:O-antigen/teichoic acid export membrane protein